MRLSKLDGRGAICQVASVVTICDGPLVSEQVAQAAEKVHEPEFVPKQGVQIETDPKASSVSKATSMGDDEGAINALIEKLEVSSQPAMQRRQSHALPLLKFTCNLQKKGDFVPICQNCTYCCACGKVVTCMNPIFACLTCG